MMRDEVAITELDAEQARIALPGLIELLQDAVNSGASLGFLQSPSNAVAEEYWWHVIDTMAARTCLLFIARKADHVVGTVQLALETRPNGHHRAEVQKLMVLQSERRCGIGGRLMRAIDEAARQHNRTLLVLDTRQGDAAAQLYRRMGYVEAGVIPRFAQSNSGALEATIFFYRLLQ